jgi:hypothetical protein
VQFTHKNLALIIISVLVVSGVFVLAEYRNKKTEKVVYNAPVVVASNTLSPELQNMDTDNDGLKDWEEVLLGTDPKKADSDGDGTPDGREVALGRNPTVKGPNDSQKESAKQAKSVAELSPTEKIARDFFARYMELNQSGLAKDQDSQVALVESVLKNGVILEKPKTLSISDIIVSSDTSNQALKTYANTVADLIKNNPHPKKDEAVIANTALEQENPEILKGIDPIIATYKNILSGLRRIPAPQNVAEMHLALVNAMNKFLFVAESLRHSDVDTLKGIGGAASYLDAGNSLTSALTDLINFYSIQTITFGPTESGSFFIKKR